MHEGCISLKEPRLHALADALTEWTIYFGVVFSPWAFGTTEPWSIWTMNGVGYLLGLLLLTKWLARRYIGWYPPQWGAGANGRCSGRVSTITGALAALTFVVLGYSALSALNARASFQSDTWQFTYYQCISWLPHSYHRPATWGEFCKLLALALVFWSVRDWLLRPVGEECEESFSSRRHYVPSRLRRLLWVLCVNGAALAMEGVVQRVSTDKLLWIAEPRVNKEPELQFGPYAYRANGAQLLNLIWPVGVGFWWVLHRAVRHRKHRGNAHHMLLSCVLLMVVGSFFSLSRGAAITAVCSVAAMFLILLSARRTVSWQTQAGVALFFIAALVLAALLIWEPLTGRFSTAEQDFMTGRVKAWQTAWSLVKSNPWFGTGPGTFSAVYQLAPGAESETWYSQLHNDWLETLVTFGFAGSGLILLALLLAATRWFWSCGLPVSRVLLLSFWIALGGCLLHAMADFPLQIYSIRFLFVLHCAILSCIARRS